RPCLEHTLTFERVRDGSKDRCDAGRTYLVLARVCAAQGHRSLGLEHAKRAQRILSADNPASISFFKAAALVKELDAG
ncbi:MAG: hypothetical protein ACRDOE_12575, partial [Streptosporangiaceae bacterium]